MFHFWNDNRNSFSHWFVRWDNSALEGCWVEVHISNWFRHNSLWSSYFAQSLIYRRLRLEFSPCIQSWQSTPANLPPPRPRLVLFLLGPLLKSWWFHLRCKWGWIFKGLRDPSTFTPILFQKQNGDKFGGFFWFICNVRRPKRPFNSNWRPKPEGSC